MFSVPSEGLLRSRTIRRSEPSYGSPFSSEPYTILKVCVVRPTPSATVITATAESAGVLNSIRMP